MAAAAACFTGAKCSATNVHWTDYAFGTAMQQDAAEAIQTAGGKVLGSARMPLGTADLSAYMLQALHLGRQGDRAGQRRRRHHSP